MINYQFYPKTEQMPSHLTDVIASFGNREMQIRSDKNNLVSDAVLAVVRLDLEKCGYTVERGKKKSEKISIPVLHGRNGSVEKSFDADAYCKENKTVIEVEAGRAVTNYQFLKDLFQASMMNDVDYLVIAVRNIYRQKKRDFEEVNKFFDAMHQSNKIDLQLEGILIIGY